MFYHLKENSAINKHDRAGIHMQHFGIMHHFIVYAKVNAFHEHNSTIYGLAQAMDQAACSLQVH